MNFAKNTETSEEAFQRMLEEEIRTTFYYSNNVVLDMFTALYYKDFFVVFFRIIEAKKYNIKIPQLSHVFLKRLIQVACDFPEYKDAAACILCHSDLDYEIGRVFDKEEGKYQMAWDLGNTANCLRFYLALFTRHGYTIPTYLIERCQSNLRDIRKNTIKKTLSDDERDQIEKCLLVTMWDKLQKLNLNEYLEMLENYKTLQLIIRLASYTLGKPLGCAHPNLAALTGTLKDHHAPFAHLTVEMIKACKLDNDSKINRNYMSLQKIAQTDQDYSCDDLIYTLFKILKKR